MGGGGGRSARGPLPNRGGKPGAGEGGGGPTDIRAAVAPAVVLAQRRSRRAPRSMRTRLVRADALEPGAEDQVDGAALEPGHLLDLGTGALLLERVHLGQLRCQRVLDPAPPPAAAPVTAPPPPDP